MTNIEDSRWDDPLGRARAVIFGSAAVEPGADAWLTKQLAWARKSLPKVPVVLFAESPDPRMAGTVVRQLQLDGYIPTSSSLELASTALRLILAGGRYVPRESDEWEESTPLDHTVPLLTEPVASPPSGRLTVRELSVLELMRLGLPNKIIAYRLGMSQSTVKAHVHNIISKLGVRNRTEAAVAYFRVLSVPKPVMPPAPPKPIANGRMLGEIE